jgi:hypothetical protein
MVGNPGKLMSLLSNNGVNLDIPKLEDTFKQMLDNASGKTA